jgi:DNA-binding XRE family transcriptional regulator
MQAVVKTPLIEITIKGSSIPKKIFNALKDEYGKKFKIVNESDDKYIDVFETDWYKKIKAETTPGDNMRIYRENHGLTQKKLGELLGDIPGQHVSNMEKGTRSISLNTAKKLSKVFKVSVEKFV